MTSLAVEAEALLAAGARARGAPRWRSTRPRKVSATPVPCVAVARKVGSLPIAAMRLISSSLRMLGRSRLLYWMTSGSLRRVEAVLAQVAAQVLERRLVRADLLHLRVGDEGHAVGALQHQLARGVVDHLAGDREQLDAHGQARRRC